MSDTVNRILVVGAGTMGSGIAQVCAMSGFSTYLYDTDPAQVEKALAAIDRDLTRGVEKGKVQPAEREQALRRIALARNLEEAAAGADAVIEAVYEDVAVKQDVFRRLAASAPAHALLATNTSALSITEIAAATNCPERVVGMHFFNPVPRMKLVEVIRGLETNQSTVDRAMDLARRLGKEPVEINEAPAFAASRINVVIGNEAFYMLMEGVASAEDIDKAVKLGLNHPMGPFELGDLVGWDIRLKVLEYMHKMLGERYRPCPLLVKYVKAGRLGRKVGKGVYTYDKEGNRV